MKSLSINAQEFVPLSNNPSTKSITNSNSGLIILSGEQALQSYQTANQYSSNNQFQQINNNIFSNHNNNINNNASALVNNNSTNQYSVYLSQPQMPQQQQLNVIHPTQATVIYGPTVPNQTHIIQSPIAGFHTPILTPSQFPFSHSPVQPINYNYTTQPQIPSSQPGALLTQFYSMPPPSTIVSPIAGFNFNPIENVQFQKSKGFNQTQKYLNNNYNKKQSALIAQNYQSNRNSKQIKNSSKQLKQQKNQSNKQTSIINSNEKDWPSLSKHSDGQNITKDDDNDEDESDEENNKIEEQAKVPYLNDPTKLQKLLKNVNFLKTAIEQHYINENNHSQSSSLKSSINDKLSFKDAILNTASKQSQSINKPNAISKDKILNKSNTAPNIEKEVQSMDSNKTDKPKRKRSRSKKKAKASDNETKTNEDVSITSQFDLANENFPELTQSDLANDVEVNFLTKLESKSDAYSSDGTLDANVKSFSNSQSEKLNSKKNSKQQLTSSKKSSQPITLEFANMISALQRGQSNKFPNKLNTSDHQKNIRSKSQSNSRNPIIASQIESKNRNQLVNPLDSTGVLKRGKEREKPKAKKHSTLKKIIIKEREEKRRQKEGEHAKLEELTINDINQSSIANSSPVDLILSPGQITNLPIKIDKDADIVMQKVCSFNTDETNSNKSDLESKASTLNNSPKKSTDLSSASESPDKANHNKSSNEHSDSSISDSNKDNGSQSSDSTKAFDQKSDKENINRDKSDDDDEDDNESIKTYKDNLKNEEVQDNQNNSNEKDTDDDENTSDDQSNDDENNTGVASNQMSPISQVSPISFNGYSPSPYAAFNIIANERNLLSLEKLEEQVKQKIHSRKFREYCNQIINKEVDAVCTALLHEIVRFQDRLYHKNPIKAKMKRRYVMGIREVTKHLKLQKLKCIILAPNCEKIQSKGGLDDAINFIIQTSMEQNVPFVFALGRKGLGKAVNKLVPISVVGIFDYSGAEEFFKKLVELANNAKLAYQEIVEEYEKEECENLILSQTNSVNLINTETDIIKSALNIQQSALIPNASSVLYQTNMNPKIPSHMAHSRTPSNGSNISIEPFYHMNYHTHSRSASGTFNYGHTTTSASGHNRSASGGGGVGINIDLSMHSNKNWTHSRTPSNCSNISYISRLSEPISEVGSMVGTLYLGSSSSSINNLSGHIGAQNAINSSTIAAVQYYTEQVRHEMRECDSSLTNSQKSQNNETQNLDEYDNNTTNKESTANANISSSLANLHLGRINEIDAGNEADTEDYELTTGQSNNTNDGKNNINKSAKKSRQSSLEKKSEDDLVKELPN